MLRHRRGFAGLLRIDYMSALTGGYSVMCVSIVHKLLGSICTGMALVWCCELLV
jgi:hypothetical protein